MKKKSIIKLLSILHDNSDDIKIKKKHLRFIDDDDEEFSYIDADESYNIRPKKSLYNLYKINKISLDFGRVYVYDDEHNGNSYNQYFLTINKDDAEIEYEIIEKYFNIFRDLYKQKSSNIFYDKKNNDMEIIDFTNFMNEKLTKKQMKLPKALRDAIEKKTSKKGKKDDDKDDTSKKDDESKKPEKINTTGLTKKQKKLPIGLQKAILKKQKSNESKKLNFSDFLTINEHSSDSKTKMLLKIHNMYGEYINDNNIDDNSIMEYIYDLITNNPELLDNNLEKN